MSHYSSFVHFSKRFLWVLVAFLILILVWVASDNSSLSGARVVFSNMEKAGKAIATAQNLMTNPNYQGVDENNRPYTIIADKAEQVDENTVSLKNIRADIMLGKEQWVSLNAGSGMLNILTKQLELSGGVDIFYTDGYEFRTQNAHIDIEQGSAYGVDPVEGQGPLGTLKATGFALLDHGKTIIFNQSVTMTLYR